MCRNIEPIARLPPAITPRPSAFARYNELSARWSVALKSRYAGLTDAMPMLTLRLRLRLVAEALRARAIGGQQYRELVAAEPG